MEVFIASADKYIGKIQEDIYIRDKYLSMGIASEISTLSKIVEKSDTGDVVILKSIWGYHIDYDIFLEHISSLEKKGIILVNDYDFIYWNIDKSKYLSDVSFLNIIPMQKLDFRDCCSVEDIKLKIELNTSNYSDDIFVLKPSIAASGFLTLLYDKNNNNEEIFSMLLSHRDLGFIIQPFRPQVTEGEISVVVLNGNLLYGISRFPGVLSLKQDPEYYDIKDIPSDILEQVKTLLRFFENKFNSLPTISRVDFVKHGLLHELMEVELIDPDLFFKYLPDDLLGKCLSELCSSEYVK